MSAERLEEARTPHLSPPASILRISVVPVISVCYLFPVTGGARSDLFKSTITWLRLFFGYRREVGISRLYY